MDVTELSPITVLKVGHHGDDDATKKSFLALTQPAYALITADRTVDPDHANPKALERLAKAGAQVFVTDEHGEIEVTSDGAELKVTVQRGA